MPRSCFSASSFSLHLAPIPDRHPRLGFLFLHFRERGGGRGGGNRERGGQTGEHALAHTHSHAVTVLETLKNVLRTKNENQEAFHLQLPLTRYQRFNRPSGLAHASWHRVSQPRGCHDFTFANFAKFANDLKPPPRRRPPSPSASPSQGLPLEEPGPLPPSESASGPPSRTRDTDGESRS